MSAERELSFGERLALARKEQMALVKGSRPANRSKQSAEARAAKAEAKCVHRNQLQQERRKSVMSEEDLARIEHQKVIARRERQAKKEAALENRTAEQTAKEILQSRKLKAAVAENNDRRPVLKMREIDYSKLIKVQVNAKTVVWIKPGTDISALKAKINKTS
jgi:hypothetical protein